MDLAPYFIWLNELMCVSLSPNNLLVRNKKRAGIPKFAFPHCFHLKVLYKFASLLHKSKKDLFNSIVVF